MDRGQRITGGLIGLAVGDALGVPVEFVSRSTLAKHPVAAMRGYGTHNQPPGTWSDDTSLTMCLAEELASDLDVHRLGQRFVRWLFKQEWTPHGRVFDVGNATREAIFRLAKGIEPTDAGGRTEESNGNGSLMRILPVALACAEASEAERVAVTRRVSCLTHAHPRSQLACVIYVEVAAMLMRGLSPQEALTQARAVVDRQIGDLTCERSRFARILEHDMTTLRERDISSDGYVVHTLEASLWSLRSTSSFAEATLKAVNLGGDSDTTGAVTGGLAGIAYGRGAIPNEWRAQLARHDELLAVARRLAA